ncbi:HNH endonuclease [Morganella morganii]|uniref:HNH endonuclease n=1 Tax=Morganella morganii TaxID=582 RepID=UPI00301C1ADD
MLTFSEVDKFLSYNPLTGDLRWKIQASSRAKVGDIAGCVRSDGYLQIQLHGKRYKNHHVAWLLSYGRWPEKTIDHVNRNRSDNRISNLRLATVTENNWNQGISARNTSGVKGVHYDHVRRRWVAQIQANGKNRQIGRYIHLHQAEAAIKKARSVIHGQFASHE